MTKIDQNITLIPFAISTSRGHYVILQAFSQSNAGKRYLKEESHHGPITSIKKVE